TSVSRQIEHVSISTGREYDGVRCVFFNFSGAQAPRHNSLGMSLDSHEVEHFGLRKHLHRAGFDLAAKRLIAAEQKLLTGLSSREKSSQNWRAAKRAVAQEPAIFAGKRHALRDTLVDNVIGDLSEPIHVRFA